MAGETGSRQGQGLRDLGRAPAGLLGVVSALGFTACNSDPCDGQRTFDAPPAPTPSASSVPTVESGAWIGGGILELSFTAPLAVGTPPDPARFAILNWGAVVSDNNYYSPNSCSSSTRYNMLRGSSYYGGSRIVDVWVAPEDPSLLRLRLDTAGASCRAFGDIVAEGVTLVYAGVGTEPQRLLDADGDPVPDIGPAWAVDSWENCIDDDPSYYYSSCRYTLSNYASGHLPSFPTLVEIPCP